MADRRRHSRFPAAAYDVVVVAASAGGIATVGTLLSALTPDLPTPIVLVQHVGPGQRYLPQVLRRRAQLPIEWARDGERLRAGHVHVAPPSAQLELTPDGRVVLDKSQRHERHPRADITFRSAAAAFGDRVMGIVLTGYGNDGAAGAAAIREAGGVVLGEDPATAIVPGMPAAALALHAPHFVLPATALPAAIVSLVAVRGAAQLFGLRATAEEPPLRVAVRQAPEPRAASRGAARPRKASVA